MSYVIKLSIHTTSRVRVEIEDRCVPKFNEKYIGEPIKKRGKT